MNYKTQASINVQVGEPEYFEGPLRDFRHMFECPTHGQVMANHRPKYETMMDGVRGLPAIGYHVHQVCDKCAEINAEELREAYNQRTSDDIAEKTNNELKKQIIKSGVSDRNVGASLDKINPVNESQAKAILQMKYILSDLKKRNGTGNSIITGSVGTGKTLVASALVADCVRFGISVKIQTVIQIFRAMKDSWRKDSAVSESKLIEGLTNVDLLVIDEVGVQFGSDTEKLFIFEIIDGRYGKMKPTILLSNLDIRGISECIGERCIDRLREDGGKILAFNFESQRKIKSKHNVSESEK